MSKDVLWIIRSNSISKSTLINWTLYWCGVHRTSIFLFKIYIEFIDKDYGKNKRRNIYEVIDDILFEKRIISHQNYKKNVTESKCYARYIKIKTYYKANCSRRRILFTGGEDLPFYSEIFLVIAMMHHEVFDARKIDSKCRDPPPPHSHPPRVC